MTAIAGTQPVAFVGLPLRSWAFAFRIWVAVVVALYTSFWLQLEAASSAALTVAILALPTRGQGIDKAGFRLIATVIGVSASIAIVGVFSQSNVLILAMFAVWTGLCVYAVGMLDGNRAYAAALSCITVALIAIQQIDSPQQVFAAGMARGSAVAVGVLSVALVNEILAAPDYYPVLTAQLEALHRRVTDYAQNILRGQATSAVLTGGLLHDIAALRPEIASLASESSNGQARSAAGRAAMVSLVAELSTAHALAALHANTTPAMRELNANSFNPIAACRAWLMEELLEKRRDVRTSLNALRSGSYPARTWRAPLYRSHRIAAASGIRATIHFGLIAILLLVAGWPAAGACLALVAIVIGLGATAPDPRAFTALAAVGGPIACLLAGILKFMILGGVSDFPLLAIGMAPFIIGPALLMTRPNPALAGLGRLNLTFILAVLSPSNPQSYDPQTFLTTSLFLCLAAILAFAAQILVPPLSNDRRIQRLLESARLDLHQLAHGLHRPDAPEEAAFRDASRIGQIVTAAGTNPQNCQALDESLRYFDRAAALRRCSAELDRLATGPLADVANSARTTLALNDAGALLASANCLHAAAALHGQNAAAACAALIFAFASTPPAAGSIEGHQP